MRCYLYDGERLVFEGEGWGIIVDDRNMVRTYSEGAVYGTHMECTKSYKDKGEDDDIYSYGENCWEPEGKGYRHAVCMMCNEAVPEGVQALILMEAWNRR